MGLSASTGGMYTANNIVDGIWAKHKGKN